jgi:hypothetical protein
MTFPTVVVRDRLSLRSAQESEQSGGSTDGDPVSLKRHSAAPLAGNLPKCERSRLWRTIPSDSADLDAE